MFDILITNTNRSWTPQSLLPCQSQSKHLLIWIPKNGLPCLRSHSSPVTPGLLYTLALPPPLVQSSLVALPPLLVLSSSQALPPSLVPPSSLAMPPFLVMSGFLAVPPPSLRPHCGPSSFRLRFGLSLPWFHHRLLNEPIPSAGSFIPMALPASSLPLAPPWSFKPPAPLRFSNPLTQP